MYIHSWKVVTQVTHDSGYEQVTKRGVGFNAKGYEDFFKRSIIVTYRCQKCDSEKVERV